MELGMTATRKPELIVERDVCYDAFPVHAQRVVDQFKLTVEDKIDGPAERMWLVKFEGKSLCISWDEWLFVVTVMPWEGTPAEVIHELHRRASPVS
jgi:hypothetical protein